MMLNYYLLKGRAKLAIVNRKQRLNAVDHSTDFAWLTYALSLDGYDNNPAFKDALDQLLNWALQGSSGIKDRSLGPMGLCAFLVSDQSKRIALSNAITQRMNVLLSKELDRFSVLNDPSQMLCIVWGVKDYIAGDLKKTLSNFCSKRGNEKRVFHAALYSACALELGVNEITFSPAHQRATDPLDLISLIWFVEKYNRCSAQQERARVWEEFSKVSEAISFEDTFAEDTVVRPLSNLEISLLYEAICFQARRVDPVILFDNYPLHERVRQITQKHFKNASYIQAVEQATRALNEYIQQKSGVFDKVETELVQSTMKSIDRPKNLKIKFNDHLSEDSGKNEQAGLALICEGIFRAYRNPKGHKPEDHSLLQLDAYEALDQIVQISYIMKRLDEAN